MQQRRRGIKENYVGSREKVSEYNVRAAGDCTPKAGQLVPFICDCCCLLLLHVVADADAVAGRFC